jgi:hypothetical protein
MKRTMPVWTHLALALAVPAWLAAVPAAAQGSHVGGGGSAGGGGGHAASSPAPSSGGSSAGSSGGGSGQSSGGGGHVSGGGGGSAGGSGGGRSSGVAVSRGSDRGGSSSGGGYSGGHTRGAAERGPGSTSSGSTSGVAGNSGSGTGDRAVTRGSGRAADGTAGGVVPEFSRPRNGQPVIGRAVPRTAGAPGTGGGTIIVPGYYGGYFPWGFGGLGLAGYYGYHGYGGYGGYDPYGFGGWTDPYDGEYGGGYTQYPQRDEEGALRLKLKPRGASVYVDGSYAGVVDDFDGIFQKLHLEPGPHHVTVQMAGYDTQSFDVHIEPNHTTTYHGELTKIP